MPYYKACYYEDVDGDMRTEVGSLPPSELQLREVDTVTPKGFIYAAELLHP